MSNAKVTGLRGIELGVIDLNRPPPSTARSGDSIRSCPRTTPSICGRTANEHHIVTLRERPKAGMLGVHFAANDKAAVNALHAKAKAFGAKVLGDPADLPRSAGGGYGFRFRTPEGHVLNISSDVAQHPNLVSDRSKPIKLSHVVLNSATIEEQTKFFIDLLGFKLANSTDMMDFIRCCADHHSIAFARGAAPRSITWPTRSRSIDGLMRGAGRLKAHGFNIEWGVGRHGPGDNVFSYFVEPNGFVVEYTAEVEQIDEAVYTAHDPKYWREFPMRPCRWGMAGHPSNRLKAAFGGDISVADPEDGKRCEEIMAQKLGAERAIFSPHPRHTLLSSAFAARHAAISNYDSRKHSLGDDGGLRPSPGRRGVGCGGKVTRQTGRRASPRPSPRWGEGAHRLTEACDGGPQRSAVTRSGDPFLSALPPNGSPLGEDDS